MKVSIVAIKELREKLLTRTFAVSMILCSLLIPTCVGSMVRLYQSRLHDYRKNRDRERNDLGQLTSWTRLWWRGITLDRRPSPLLVFSAGVERNVRSRVRIDWYWSRTRYVGAPGSNPLLAATTNLDYSAVVRIVMSLLTILLLHDSVSGEKEGGTLRLLIVSGAPRDVIIMGKYLGGMATVALPFLVGTLLGLVVLIWSLPGAFHAADLLRGGILLGISLLYVSTFALLAIFVSARCSRSSTALTALLLLWILLVLVVPKASVLVARVALNTKSEADFAREVRAEFRDAERAAYSQYRTWRRKRENRRKPWREKSMRHQGFRREMFREATAKVARIRADYFRGVQRQTHLAMHLSRVSPAASFSYVAMRLARSDAERSNRYLQEADRYRELARSNIEHLSAIEEGDDVWGSRFRKLGPVDLGLLPKFEFRESPLLHSLADSGLDLGLLAGTNILLLMVCNLAFLRYSPV